MTSGLAFLRPAARASCSRAADHTLTLLRQSVSGGAARGFRQRAPRAQCEHSISDANLQRYRCSATQGALTLEPERIELAYKGSSKNKASTAKRANPSVVARALPKGKPLDQEPLVDHGALRDVPRRVRLADQPDEVVQQEDEEDTQGRVPEPDVRDRKSEYFLHEQLPVVAQK